VGVGGGPKQSGKVVLDSLLRSMALGSVVIGHNVFGVLFCLGDDGPPMNDKNCCGLKSDTRVPAKVLLEQVCQTE